MGRYLPEVPKRGLDPGLLALRPSWGRRNKEGRRAWAKEEPDSEPQHLLSILSLSISKPQTRFEMSTLTQREQTANSGPLSLVSSFWGAASEALLSSHSPPPPQG